MNHRSTADTDRMSKIERGMMNNKAVEVREAVGTIPF
jgi:hypothetical protein